MIICNRLSRRKQTELTSLQDKKQKQIALQTQLHFIMELRATSFQAVTLLNGIASAVPSAVSLEKNRAGRR